MKVKKQISARFSSVNVDTLPKHLVDWQKKSSSSCNALLIACRMTHTCTNEEELKTNIKLD